MNFRRTAVTALATGALVLLPATAFAGGSNDDGGDYRDRDSGCHECEYPRYAPPCPDKGDHRPDRPKPEPRPTVTQTVTRTVTVTRTLHTL